MSLFSRLTKPMTVPDAGDALAGRAEPIATATHHALSGVPLKGPWPGMESAVFAMGCFWGVERIFWQKPGVWLTMVGYAGGYTPNPTYEEVCTGRTGHNEVVRVVYDPNVVTYEELLQAFWEGHDPTQGMRQGNDVGTQYRSGIYWHDEAQRAVIDAVRAEVDAAQGGRVVTEVEPERNYWRAEDYHQHYFANHPGQGYCAFVVAPKVEKFRRTFRERVRQR